MVVYDFNSSGNVGKPKKDLESEIDAMEDSDYSTDFPKGWKSDGYRFELYTFSKDFKDRSVDIALVSSGAVDYIYRSMEYKKIPNSVYPNILTSESQRFNDIVEAVKYAKQYMEECEARYK